MKISITSHFFPGFDGQRSQSVPQIADIFVFWRVFEKFRSVIHRTFDKGKDRKKIEWFYLRFAAFNSDWMFQHLAFLTKTYLTNSTISSCYLLSFFIYLLTSFLFSVKTLQEHVFHQFCLLCRLKHRTKRSDVLLPNLKNDPNNEQ